MESLKRPHHLITVKRDNQIGCTTTTTTTGSDDESPSTSLIKLDSSKPPASASASLPECSQVPYILLLKQLGWRIRSRWRHLLIRRRHRCNAAGLRFNYDLRSYAQNFDDGRRASIHDRRSPLAP